MGFSELWKEYPVIVIGIAIGIGLPIAITVSIAIAKIIIPMALVTYIFADNDGQRTIDKHFIIATVIIIAIAKAINIAIATDAEISIGIATAIVIAIDGHYFNGHYFITTLLKPVKYWWNRLSKFLRTTFVNPLHCSWNKLSTFVRTILVNPVHFWWNKLVLFLRSTLSESPVDMVENNRNNFTAPDCPVCLEEMKPPTQIFNCRNGHLICADCRPRLSICTNCRAEYTGRATAVEQMTRQMFNVQ